MKKSTAVHILLVLISCRTTFNAMATVVSFGFSGTVSSLQNGSNALPAGITNGTSFTGIATYDTSAVLGGVDFDPSPNSGAYYFNQNGGLWLSANFAGHSFDAARPSPGDPYADIIIYNFPDPQDTFWIDASAPTIRMDGAPLPGTYTTSGFSLILYDNTGTSYTNDVLPIIRPNLSAFTNSHRVEIYAYTAQGNTFYLTGNITDIGEPRPILTIRALGNQTVRLSWPTAARGFQLLQNTNLTAGIGWQTNSTPIVDTETEHTVIVSVAGTTFCRLKSP